MTSLPSLSGSGIGIGLRHPHYPFFLESKRDVAFLEVHPENYFCGGKNRTILDDIAADYRLSLHGVGLSLGSADGLDAKHVQQLKTLVEAYQPMLISDHVSWSATGNAHLNDLLPLPYTEESLTVISDNIDHVQQTLGRQMLVENPSSYCAFTHSTMSEVEFLNHIVERTGCGLILDINNIYVQAHNHGDDAVAYIDAVNVAAVQEMHLAGHISQEMGESTLLIDTHSQPVCADVWTLYAQAVARFPDAVTLIEWDKDIPEPEVLIEEAKKAATIRHPELDSGSRAARIDLTSRDCHASPKAHSQ